MAPTETSQTQKMSPAGQLRSLQGECQPCTQDNHHNHHHSNHTNTIPDHTKTIPDHAKTIPDHATTIPDHAKTITDHHNNNNNNNNNLTHRKATELNTTEKAQKAKKKDEDDEDYEGKLWSVGCKSALCTTFLYVYGNNVLLGHLPTDPRVDSWLFMQSPTPAYVACILYIAFCTYFGPRFMRNRDPPKGLKEVMIAYNAFQVVFSAWMFYEGGMAGWFGSYSFICQPCDFSNSPQALRMLNAAVWYNFSKFIDFLDTIFFVLNKKYSHISLLHVTHHSLMPIGIWYGLRHEAGGQTTFFGFLNCFVHTVMYLYYLLAAMGPRVRPYLWWKKYLTKLQMVQFVAMFVHALTSISLGCKAGLPLMRIILVMAAIFQLLFTDFYIKAYLKRASSRDKKPVAYPVFCSTLNTPSEQKEIGNGATVRGGGGGGVLEEEDQATKKGRRSLHVD